jgi:hypothetical protein
MLLLRLEDLGAAAWVLMVLLLRMVVPCEAGGTGRSSTHVRVPSPRVIGHSGICWRNLHPDYICTCGILNPTSCPWWPSCGVGSWFNWTAAVCLPCKLAVLLSCARLAPTLCVWCVALNKQCLKQVLVLNLEGVCIIQPHLLLSAGSAWHT